MTRRPGSRQDYEDPTKDSNGDPAEGNPEATRSSGVMKVAEKARTYESGKHRVSTGWTVVDQYEQDGFRYRLTRRPVDPEVGGVRLTPREEEVLGYACDGSTNKEIASTLGLAPSTVGVLLFRAAAKMGVRSRSELLSAYLRMKKDAK